MNNDERITYEEFMIMFKNAPKLAYMLYDKAEDEMDKLNNIIDKLQKENKHLKDLYNQALKDYDDLESEVN